MDTDSLVYHIKTEDFYEDIAKDVNARFHTSGYNKKDARPLPIGLNKKVIGLMKDELEGKIMTEFVALRPKLYAYRKLSGNKRCKGIKKCVVEKMLVFDDYKKCLFDPVAGKSIYRSQLKFRNKKYEVHTVEVNKVALNRDDDSSIDFSIYLHTIFHSVFTFTVQSPQNLRSNPYNRKLENGSSKFFFGIYLHDKNWSKAL